MKKKIITASCFVIIFNSALAKMIGDSAFQPSVKNPAFTTEHPKVILDQGHNNLSATDGRYNGIINLLKSDGFDVIVSHQAMTSDLLKDSRILYISAALPPKTEDNPHAIDPYAFNSAEVSLITAWVKNGGSLLVMSDHEPMGEPIANLLKEFGIQGSHGTTECKSQMAKSFDDASIIEFQSADMELEHPIVKGRFANEKIKRVIAFSGQSITGPQSSHGFLKFGQTAIDKYKSGISKSAGGRFEAITLKYGKGRVVVFGDATVFTAKIDTQNKMNTGMNFPETDNIQLALNTFHWLAGILD